MLSHKLDDILWRQYCQILTLVLENKFYLGQMVFEAVDKPNSKAVLHENSQKITNSQNNNGIH